MDGAEAVMGETAAATGSCRQGQAGAAAREVASGIGGCLHRCVCQEKGCRQVVGNRLVSNQMMTVRGVWRVIG